MSKVILLNKPYGVICQFTPSGEHGTLKDYVAIPDVYPAGRLDTDSEGLVVLTDDGRLQSMISNPRHELEKGYWVQVEGMPAETALKALRSGVELPDGPTRPATARVIEEPAGLWERKPPIRSRKAIPTAWLEIGLREGRNRQIRKMTAKVGLPTLRLIRFRIGPWGLENLAPGEWRETPLPERASLSR
jgi:23S rRNA pseudouridine2457 synthase